MAGFVLSAVQAADIAVCLLQPWQMNLPDRLTFPVFAVRRLLQQMHVAISGMVFTPAMLACVCVSARKRALCAGSPGAKMPALIANHRYSPRC